MPAPILIGTHQGFEIYFQGISYNCPRLKLYGYGTERQLKAAITRKLRHASR